MDHTPEPWHVTLRTTIFSYQSHPVCPVSRDTHTPDISDKKREAYAEANARRIVACVNACAGLPTDVLEATTVKELMAMTVPPTEKEKQVVVEWMKETGALD